MSSHPVRSLHQQKTNLELDLNHDPPPENVQEDKGGPSQQPQVPMIDVNVIDDDVIESSPRAFAEAKTNARRVRRRITIDVDSEDEIGRDLPNQTIIDLDSNSSSMSENDRSPEPPKEPVFNCPVCMAPFVEEMSTRCGHIFCKSCIKTAITTQGKCPTCRKKVTMRQLIRVFLPLVT